MFERILLPIDLIDRHQKAMSGAVDLARQKGGEVLLLHVIEIIAGMDREDEFYERLERAARKHLGQLSEHLATQQVPSHIEILFGNRAQEIVRYAGEKNVDLVILTAPLATPEAVSFGLGSLSYKVGMFAPCPVLLVKEEKKLAG
jgi:nucleotide-binding universal stress UspA family protein